LYYERGLEQLKSASVNLCDAGNDQNNPSFYNQYLYDPIDSDNYGTALCQHQVGALSTGCGGVDLSNKPTCKNKVIASRIHSKYT
ncbi:hypothetical protein ABE42_13090, partial [Bacillus thuringiensis]|nr:hypothetical protein [Bacillus thuringiensis]